MKNRNLRSIFTLALSTVLFVSVPAPAALAADDPAATAESAKAPVADTVRPGQNLRTDLEEPENAIGKDAAIARALAEAGISAGQAGDITVHVTGSSDGSILYRVHFTANGQRYSVKVNAVSGEILCSDVRSTSDSDRVQGRNRRGGGQGQPNGGRSGRERGGDQNQRGGKRDGSCLDPESTAETGVRLTARYDL